MNSISFYNFFFLSINLLSVVELLIFIIKDIFLDPALAWHQPDRLKLLPVFVSVAQLHHVQVRAVVPPDLLGGHVVPDGFQIGRGID